MIGDIQRPQRRTEIMVSSGPTIPAQVNRALIGADCFSKKAAAMKVRLIANSQAGIDHSITPDRASSIQELDAAGLRAQVDAVPSLLNRGVDVDTPRGGCRRRGSWWNFATTTATWAASK